MRRALFLTIAMLAPLPALADLHEDLLRAAHAGDDDTVEAMIRGAETNELQRNLVGWLAASHPETRRFVENWVSTDPTNAVALTARSWSLFDAAFLERGQLTPKHSWPDSLTAARGMFSDAFGLADAAVSLEPDFLPASDALMVTGMVTSHQDRVLAEAERILAIRPNRHSLIVATTSMAPHWGGSLRLVEALCAGHAESLPDAPDFTIELCLLQTVLDGNFRGESMDWAKERLPSHFDNPVMEPQIIAQAESGWLPAELADKLRTRLMAEDRLTVSVALSGRPEIVQLPQMPDLEAIEAALQRDLAKAINDADRRPGSPVAVGRLSELYEMDIQMKLQRIGYFRQEQPADIEAKYDAVMKEQAAFNDDLKSRSMALLVSAPRNVKALDLAAWYLTDHFPDPLNAARWNLALLANSIVYTNNLHVELGMYLSHANSVRADLDYRIRLGRAPAYSEAELDAVFACPYVRAVRLLAQACEQADIEPWNCYGSFDSSGSLDFVVEDSVVADVEARDVCRNEREGSLQSIRFEEIDLGL